MDFKIAIHRVSIAYRGFFTYNLIRSTNFLLDYYDSFSTERRAPVHARILDICPKNQDRST